MTQQHDDDWSGLWERAEGKPHLTSFLSEIVRPVFGDTIPFTHTAHLYTTAVYPRVPRLARRKCGSGRDRVVFVHPSPNKRAKFAWLNSVSTTSITL